VIDIGEMIMSATSMTKAATPLLGRILQEGYGPGAWHGPDLKAALDDVGTDLAFWRPSPARHNIAEIALHHAYFARQVRGQLTGKDPGPFVLDGEEWFAVPDGSRLSWPAIREAVDAEQRQLADAVAAAADDKVDLVLGITCHAVYHAGQVQLLKRLAEEGH
jgi:hypothetical protein